MWEDKIFIIKILLVYFDAELANIKFNKCQDEVSLKFFKISSSKFFDLNWVITKNFLIINIEFNKYLDKNLNISVIKFLAKLFQKI